MLGELDTVAGFVGLMSVFEGVSRERQDSKQIF